MEKSLTTLAANLAAKLELGNGADLITTLKQTVFSPRTKPTDAQVTALLMVANQYNLNPWTKEIYAFPDKAGGIVPVVGVDGWSRIINAHPQFDGVEFEQTDDACTCRIYRKDRTRPTMVTEFLAECRRNSEPWRTHPRRMLRHKSLIQCARVAFSFTGIVDPDEADAIVGNQETAPKTVEALPVMAPEHFATVLNKWRSVIADGSRTHDDMLAFLSTKYTLTDDQVEQIIAIGGEAHADA